METNGLIRATLENYSPASNLLNNETIVAMKEKGAKVYHFGFGQSPFPLMEEAVQGLTKHVNKSAYLPVIGIPALRKAICDFHQLHDDLNFDPDDVIVGPGSKELIFLLLTVFQGDIIVISPSWTTYKPQVMLAQHTPRVLETSLSDQWKITAQSLTKFLDENRLSRYKLLIMNNPDNPTGTSYTADELEALATVCRKNNVLVVADEIYARLKFNHDHVSMTKFYPEGTILCSGLSKWASAGGWRVGYHIYPKQLERLRAAVRSAASHTYTSVAAPIQYAASEFLQNVPACQDYMKHTTRIMEAVAKYCHRELTSVGVRAIEPTAGYYIFPDFEVIKASLKRRGISTCEEMVNALFEETSISVMAGGPAFLRPLDELTTRLCYVDFDGSLALQESRKIGLDTSIPETFVQENCKNVFEGIQLLKAWVQQQQSSDKQ